MGVRTTSSQVRTCSREKPSSAALFAARAVSICFEHCFRFNLESSSHEPLAGAPTTSRASAPTPAYKHALPDWRLMIFSSCCPDSPVRVLCSRCRSRAQPSSAALFAARAVSICCMLSPPAPCASVVCLSLSTDSEMQFYWLHNFRFNLESSSHDPLAGASTTSRACAPTPAYKHALPQEGSDQLAVTLNYQLGQAAHNCGGINLHLAYKTGRTD